LFASVPPCVEVIIPVNIEVFEAVILVRVHFFESLVEEVVQLITAVVVTAWFRRTCICEWIIDVGIISAAVIFFGWVATSNEVRFNIVSVFNITESWRISWAATIFVVDCSSVWCWDVINVSATTFIRSLITIVFLVAIGVWATVFFVRLALWVNGEDCNIRAIGFITALLWCSTVIN